MTSIARILLIVTILISPLAQAKCENQLSWGDHFRRINRIFAVISIAIMPVQDTVIPPVPTAIEQVEPWQKPPSLVLIQRHYRQVIQDIQYERAQPQPDREYIVELEKDLEALREEYPFLNAQN